ncbi:MAG: protein kinase [Planctomycetales bacterium]|nr:protein kinase [Planctomycetales bacterium]
MPKQCESLGKSEACLLARLASGAVDSDNPRLECRECGCTLADLDAFGGQVAQRLGEAAEVTSDLRSDMAAIHRAGKLAAGVWGRDPDKTSAPRDPDETQVESANAHDLTVPALAEIAKLTTQLPGYEDLEQIGKGGMGVVYKARHLKLRRTVALKMIKPGEFDDPSYIQRFQSEAAAAAQLDHPGIVQVFDVGEFAGRHYFSMALVDGGNLSQLVAEHPLVERRAAEITVQIADAIAAAHARGLIHRDLKPANVLLDADGNPRITDFGLAKSITGESDLTATGQVLGTPSYMPPEQATGDISQVREAADIYSIGAILYHLVTGRPPFHASNSFDTLRQVIEQEPVPPSRLNSKVSHDLETICLKCLEKEPARRYVSARELADDLNRFLRHEPIQARAITPAGRFWRWCKRNPVVSLLSAAVLLALLFGGAGTTYFAKVAERRAVVRAEEAVASEREARQLRAQAERGERLARKRLAASFIERGWRAFQQADPAAALLWHAEAMRTEMEAPGEIEERPDETNHRIRLAEVLAWTPKPPLILYHDGAVRKIVYSRDGRRVVTASDDGAARIWDAETGEPVGQPLRHGGIVNHAVFSADGQLVATASDDHTARIWNANTGLPVTEPLPHDQGVLIAAFHPAGNRLVTGGRGALIRLWNVADGTLVREPWRYTSPGLNGWVQSAAFSPDGSRLVAAGRVSQISFWDAETGQAILEPTKYSTAGNYLEFSPDGKHLLICGQPGDTQVLDVETAKPVLPTVKASTWGSYIYATYAPNGKRFATAYTIDKHAQIWDAADGKLVAKTGEHRQDITHCAFSPDSRLLATAGEAGGVWFWNAETGEAESMEFAHDHRVSWVAWRPDGRQFAAACGDGTARLWDTSARLPEVETIARPEPQRSVKSYQLSRDGNRLLIEYDQQRFAVYELPSCELVTKLFQIEEKLLSFHFSETGRYLAVRIDPEPEKNHPSSYVRYGPAAIFDLSADQPTLHHLKGPDLKNGYPNYAKDIHFTSDDGCVGVLHNSGVDLFELPALNKRATAMQRSGYPQPTDTFASFQFDRSGQHLLVHFQTHEERDGKRLESGTNARRFSAIDGKPAGEIFEYDPERPWQPPAEFSPDGKLAYVQGSDGFPGAWDLQTGKRQESLSRDAVMGSSVYFEVSPNGKRMLEYSGQRWKLRTYDIEADRPLTPRIEFYRRFKASFTPDGRRVVVYGPSLATTRWDKNQTEGLAKLWDAASGQQVTPDMHFEDAIDHLKPSIFSLDGRFFVGTSADGDTVVRAVRRLDWPVEEIVTLAHLAAHRRIDETGAIVPLERAQWEEIRGQLSADRTEYLRQPLATAQND